MSERVTLELIFAQGQRVLDEIREVRAELREQRQRLGAIESEMAHVGTELARLDARLDRIMLSASIIAGPMVRVTTPRKRAADQCSRWKRRKNRT